MSKHEPWCATNTVCAVYHANGICNDPKPCNCQGINKQISPTPNPRCEKLKAIGQRTVPACLDYDLAEILGDLINTVDTLSRDYNERHFPETDSEFYIRPPLPDKEECQEGCSGWHHKVSYVSACDAPDKEEHDEGCDPVIGCSVARDSEGNRVEPGCVCRCHKKRAICTAAYCDWICGSDLPCSIHRPSPVASTKEEIIAELERLGDSVRRATLTSLVLIALAAFIATLAYAMYFSLT